MEKEAISSFANKFAKVVDKSFGAATAAVKLNSDADVLSHIRSLKVLSLNAIGVTSGELLTNESLTPKPPKRTGPGESVGRRADKIFE